MQKKIQALANVTHRKRNEIGQGSLPSQKRKFVQGALSWAKNIEVHAAFHENKTKKRRKESKLSKTKSAMIPCISSSSCFFAKHSSEMDPTSNVKMKKMKLRRNMNYEKREAFEALTPPCPESTLWTHSSEKNFAKHFEMSSSSTVSSTPSFRYCRLNLTARRRQARQLCWMQSWKKICSKAVNSWCDEWSPTVWSEYESRLIGPLKSSWILSNTLQAMGQRH